MGENEQKGNGGVPAAGDLPETSYDMEKGTADPSEGHAELPLRPGGSDLILDEHLTSAAAPFLYLLSIILIAIGGYFLYNFFHS